MYQPPPLQHAVAPLRITPAVSAHQVRKVKQYKDVMEQEPAGGGGERQPSLNRWCDKISEADAHLALPYVKGTNSVVHATNR